MSDSNRAPRLAWIDAMRGAAIVLVVLYHSTLFVGHHTPAPEQVWDVNNTFAPVRMPAMMLLSGWLVDRSLRKGARRYVTGKLTNLVHPFLVWSVLLLAFHVLLHPDEAAWSLLVEAVTEPVAHLWFLAYLALYYAVALVSRAVPPWLVSVAAFVAAAARGGGPDDRLLFLLGFFMLGVWLGRNGERVDRVMTHRLMPVVAAVGFVLLWRTAQREGSTLYDTDHLALAVLGVAAMAWLFRVVGHTPAAAPLRHVGELSLIYYLVSWPGGLLTDRAVELSGVHVPGAAFVVTAGGLLAGWLAVVVVRRAGPLGHLFSAAPRFDRAGRPVDAPASYDSGQGGSPNQLSSRIRRTASHANTRT